MATPPEIIDESYISIRDMRDNNNNFGTDGRFSNSKEFVFPAYITNFTDEFTSNYESTNVYGRMDPIYVYQDTQRVINLSFNCPARSENDSSYYIDALSALARSMYPNYANTGTGRLATSIISSPPMFGIQFGNLIGDPLRGPLLGVIPSFTFAPLLEEGMFIQKTEGRTLNGSANVIYLPKNIEVSLTFNPLHDFPLGFDDAKNIRSEDFKSFPYTSGAPSNQSISAADLAAQAAGADRRTIDDSMDNYQTSVDDAPMSQMAQSQVSDILSSNS